jgi:hypothetical protein
MIYIEFRRHNIFFQKRKECLHYYKGKGKPGKVVPVLLLTEHHVLNAYWGSEGKAPRILNLCTD